MSSASKEPPLKKIKLEKIDLNDYENAQKNFTKNIGNNSSESSTKFKIKEEKIDFDDEEIQEENIEIINSLNSSTNMINQVTNKTNEAANKANEVTKPKIKQEKTRTYVAIIKSNKIKFPLPKIKEESSTENPFSCPKCERTYKTEKSLKQHSYKHKEGKFKCKKCSKTFSMKGVYLKHQCIICSTCNKIFRDKEKLTNHMRNYHREESKLELYQCDHCGKEFGFKFILRDHMIDTHASGEKRFKCKDCGKSFNSTAKYHAHKKNHVYENCKICEKKIPSIAMQNHIKGVHGNERNFHCKTCSASFKTKLVLAAHEKGHERKFCCEICGKKFPLNSRLQIHLKLHENPNFYSCNVCKRKFAMKYELQRHRKSHDVNAIYKFNCDRCDFKTDQDFLKEKHLKLHLKEDNKRKMNPNGPKCEICDKIYVSNYQLNSHLKNVHSAERYECDICGYITKWKIYLPIHFQKCHLRKSLKFKLN